MQRPCAHAETDASLVAGPGRTLTSVRPLLPTRRTGRAAARPGRNLLHQPSAASRNQTHFLNMRKQRQQSDGRYKMILCSLRFLLFNKILLKWQDFTVLHSKGTHRSTSQSKSIKVNISEYNQYNIVFRILFPPRRIPVFGKYLAKMRFCIPSPGASGETETFKLYKNWDAPNSADNGVTGARGVSPAVFGLRPKTFHLKAAGGTPAAATGTVALPNPKRMAAQRILCGSFFQKSVPAKFFSTCAAKSLACGPIQHALA